MGTRGKYETIAEVVQAFVQQTTWRQAHLAREIGVSSRQLSTVLRELQRSGMPLESENEPPHVVWSVPNGWFPGGVFFEEDHLPLLIDAVLRVPDEYSKNLLLHRLATGKRAAPLAIARLGAAVRATLHANEEHPILLKTEQAILQGQPLRLRYFSSHSGEIEDRTITPLRVFLEPRPRIAALCHRDRKLKWFRIDNIERAEPAAEVAMSHDEEAMNAFLDASVDGFNDGTETEHAFVVRSPESRWVKRNLPPGMTIDAAYPSSSGLRVRARGGLLVVARFVVGLGCGARAESPALREAVRELARGALEANVADGTERANSARQ